MLRGKWRHSGKWPDNFWDPVGAFPTAANRNRGNLLSHCSAYLHIYQALSAYLLKVLLLRLYILQRMKNRSSNRNKFINNQRFFPNCGLSDYITFCQAQTCERVPLKTFLHSRNWKTLYGLCGRSSVLLYGTDLSVRSMPSLPVTITSGIGIPVHRQLSRHSTLPVTHRTSGSTWVKIVHSWQ